MTIHPYLFPALFVAGVSMAGAAILRRVVRREYAALLQWLKIWGVICTFPALFFLFLCLPGFEETADQLRGTMTGTGMELLAGAAGVLPGLLWDEAAERREKNWMLPFGLSPALFRMLLIAALVAVVLIPYGFLFDSQSSEAWPAPADSADTALSTPKTAAASATEMPLPNQTPEMDSLPQTGNCPAPAPLSAESRED